MKTKFVKILYKIFSFLTDKTNGAKFFAKPKLFFGAMLIGMGVSSCGGLVTCYAPPDPTCYDPIPNDTTQVDTTQNQEDDILCYYAGEPTENTETQPS
ncbi:MAG: hypothetical protein LBN95_12195 [Prevotellaceae bacterium]|nr:hypothetical protein [Prevotellaceae bacterium]